MYGYIIKKSCLKNLNDFSEIAIDEYKNVKTHYLPDVFVDLRQKVIAVKENKVSDLQNVFISIGILGTFIGLGIAIKDAAELLNDESIDISKLNSVLGVIAFKFQISVWGTIFSLVFQKLVAEPYFEKKEEILAGILESLYSNQIDIRTTLENQLKAVINIDETSKMQLKEINSMQNSFKDYVDVASDFANNVKIFGNNVELFHGQMINTVEKIAKDLIEEQEKLRIYARDTIDQFIVNINMMYQKIENGQMSMADMQKEIHVDIVRSIEVLQKVFVRSEDKYMRDAQDRFNSMLKSSLMAFHGEYIDAAHRLSDVVDKLNKELNGIDTGVNSIRNEFISEQKLFREIMKEALLLENQHRDRIQECYSNMEKIWKEMSICIEKNNINFQKFTGDLKNDLKELEAKYADNHEILKSSVKLFSDSIEKTLYEHNEQLKKINSNIINVINTTSEANKQLDKLPNEISENCINRMMSFNIPFNK